MLPTPCPHTACRHCTHHLFYHPSPLYHHPCLHSCPQLHLCLSRSRYRSPSTCVPLADARYVSHRLVTHCLPVPLPSDCCPHTVHMSVCTTALVCYSTMPTVLGSATLLTILHRPHLLCVTLVACATTSPLRESTLTPCRFHHPYRSLTLAHRVVPPLVVPVPSLAVSGVRLFFMVPLVGESPLADARLRLTPMVTCCSLSARPHIMHHYLPAPLLYAYMSAFLFTCLLPILSTPCLQYFIQPCQHNAASIVHQIRQSPQPPVQHICTHKGGAACERQRVPSPRVHICSVDMMLEVRLSERQRARPSPARARLVTSGYFD